MIKQFIDKLLDKAASATVRRKSPFGKRRNVPPRVHGIDPALIDARAIEVVSTLQTAGHEAYIVGGAVRDLLLGLRPKDFDVATNATPEQVKQLFRRAFIIGRRFRIVHVVFGRGRDNEVVEVSTFRAYLDNAAAEAVAGSERSRAQLAGVRHAVDASGRVLRDNVWGPQEQDAARRDFSINAMYYDPRTQTVVDYHKGIEDTKKRVLRMIGDAAARYREDPVRIIRAVRFAAKLHAKGFTLSPATAKPLTKCRALLCDVPPSRLFDEMLKLLQTGHALASVQQLRALGLAQGIYPLLDVIVQRAEQPFIHAALLDTDRRIEQGKPVVASFLLACVLWQDVLGAWRQRQSQGGHNIPALHAAIDEVFERRIGDIAGRGKLAADMREIWAMQPRFDRRSPAAAQSLLAQPRFRAGFDFMRLRADVGEIDEALPRWWQQYQDGDDATRQDLLEQVRAEQRARSKTQRDSASPRPMLHQRAHPENSIPPESQACDCPAETAPKKRRRRRPKKHTDADTAPEE